MSFSIVLKDGLKDVEVKKMQKNLEALPYIKSTEYISKERAAAELEDELGENPETFLGFNPLQASIEVKLHSQYANPDSLRLIEDKIKSYTSVSELLYRKDMMELVQSNMERIGIILLSLVAILMVISFVLISNTIRLLIYSRRFLIHTMQLVGDRRIHPGAIHALQCDKRPVRCNPCHLHVDRRVVLFANGISRFHTDIRHFHVINRLRSHPVVGDFASHAGYGRIG